MNTSSPVAVIGLGIMGGAIARNLLADGVAVRGYDIDAARFEILKTGGVAARSAGEAARDAGLALTSLPSIAALDETVSSFIVAGLKGLVVAELSTLPMAAKEAARSKLAAAGI